MNFIVNTMNVSLLVTGHLLKRAVVLIKELVRNKIDSCCTFRHYPILKGLIPGLLEKG